MGGSARVARILTTDPARLPGLAAHAAEDPFKSLRSHADSWERRYLAWVVSSDLVAMGLAALAGLLIVEQRSVAVSLTMAAVTAVIMVCALLANRAWSRQSLGEGAQEYQRLGRGLFSTAIAIAFLGLIFADLAVRPWIFGVIPLAGALALVQRYLLRRLLHRARRQGRCLLPVMAAGNLETVRDLIARTRYAPHVGWRVEAVCLDVDSTQANRVSEVDGVPVVGILADLADHVHRGGYRVVAVTADQYWTPRRLQRLAWDLEDTKAEMVVAPVLMEVGGPRLQVSGVLGMPLLRVAAPAFTGGRRVIKSIVDRLAALLLLIALAPLYSLIAIAIKCGSRGPVIYRQRRVGRAGQVFTMYKFRTMVVNAHELRSTLQELNEATGPLFKLRKDPRVTRVGAILRRYSLDELPQLVNVLTGRMSLVGPRPPLPEETKSYESDVHRRLLVKPGLTGLWQVSGRSNLTWAESVRLDLRYVEDWSLALDAAILWKTLRAVISGQGAY